MARVVLFLTSPFKFAVVEVHDVTPSLQKPSAMAWPPTQALRAPGYEASGA